MSHKLALDAVTPDGMDFAAMGAAFVAYFLLSFVWWGPLFGKRWNVLMGFPANDNQPMGKAMLLQTFGTLLLTYMFWYVMQVMVVTHTADGSGLERTDATVLNGVAGGVFTWMGFFLPVQLGRVAWEKASWALFGINAGGHLVCLVAMGIVLGLF